MDSTDLNPRQAMGVLAKIIALRGQDSDCAAVVNELRALLEGPREGPLLRITCFGGFRVLGTQAGFAAHEPRRGRAFLQYLIVNSRRTISRERLAEVFWPDQAPESVKHRVHMAASGARSFLRRILDGFDAIRCTAEGYAWHPSLQIESDVAQFAALCRLGTPQALREAVSLYRGELLEGEHGEWLAPARVKFATMHATALEKVARNAFQERDIESALNYGQDLLGLDRAHESAARLVMRCFELLGRRSRAVAEYRMLREHLRRHLGTEPMPETTAVLRAIVAPSYGSMKRCET